MARRSSLWRQFEMSFDADQAEAASTPVMAAISAGSVVVVLGALGYVPALAEASGFRRPWVSLVLGVLGGGASWLAGRHRCRGRVGTAATLVDNSLFSAALAYAATHTEGAYAVGLAVTHGLMVLAFPAQSYGLSALFALAMGLPVVGALWMSPPPTVALILTTSYLMTLALAYVTGKRQQLQQQQARLSQAFGVAREVADESIQAALASTLLSLGHFIHELKNYQTAIQANLSFIEMAGDLNEQQREALSEALDAQYAEQELVVKTLDSLKERARDRNTVFVLGEVLSSCAEESPGIPVTVEGPRGTVLIPGNRDHLRVVLANLVRNAGQAGATQVHIHAALQANGQHVRLRVEDDGPGIPAARRDDLFEAFGASTTRGGSGFGLYLCRRYIELLGGTIDAGQGTLGGAAFEIVLPARVVARGKTAEAPPMHHTA